MKKSDRPTPNIYKMIEYLFSYGTLQKKDVQLKLFGRKLQGNADVLEGYATKEIEIKDEAFLSKGEDKKQLTLIPAKGNAIQGTALEITKEELITADNYEPSNYKRILLTLASGKKAWLYVATEI